MSALPWRPPVASWLESRLAAWADGAGWPCGGVLALGWGRVATEDDVAVAARVTEPSAVALAIEGPVAAGIAIVPWPVVAALVRTALGTDTGLDGPRPPTAVERAIVSVAVADLLARAGLAAQVGLGRPAPPRGPAAVVTLVVTAPCRSTLTVVVPASPPAPVRALASLVAARGGRLPSVRAVVELASGALPATARGRLARLVGGDVIAVGRSSPTVRLGRGQVTGSLDLAAGELTVASTYQRTPPMTATPPPSTDASGHLLADDLAIPLTVVAGEVSLSARALLELAPGSILALGRPLGGAVELRADDRAIARGELVEIDGALGVRVVEVLPAPSRLVDDAGSVLGPAPR